MTVAPLNPWLDTVLAKAGRLFEDSDRLSFAAAEFLVMIHRVHRLCTIKAHVAPEPKLERLVLDDGAVLLSLEWHDKSSGWHLYFAVRRKTPTKPVQVLEFSGNPTSYAADKPTDDDIARAMHDYFEEWKTRP